MTMILYRAVTGVHIWPPSISLYRVAVCSLSLYHIIFKTSEGICFTDA